MNRLLITALAFGLAQPALAAGYTTADTSVVSMATGGTGVARSADPAAAFINPAATLATPGLKLSFGAILAAPSLEARGSEASTATQSSVSVPPNAHLSFGTEDFSVGGSLTVPYGSGVAWPSDWEYRFDIVSANMRVLRASAFMAAALGPLQIAAGPYVDFGKLTLNRQLDFITHEGSVDIDTQAQGLGGHVALFIQPLEGLSIGATYRSKTTLAFDGYATFETPLEFQSRATSGPVTSKLVLPDRLAFGIEWQPVAALHVSAELEKTNWSSVSAMVIDFEDPGTEDVEKERSWDDTLATRLGATYSVTPQTEVRLGGFFDPSPVPEQTVGVDSPDSTRVGFTTGFGTMLSATTGLDVAYQYIHFQGAQSTATESPLSFEGAAHLLGVSLRYVL